MTTPIDRDEVHRRLTAAHNALGTEDADEVAADTAIKAARKALVTFLFAFELTKGMNEPLTDEPSEPKR